MEVPSYAEGPLLLKTAIWSRLSVAPTGSAPGLFPGLTEVLL
jgi:hypothetical protein